MPERMEYSLSDSFRPSDKEASLECKATVININAGNNCSVMKKCGKLREYSAFA